MRYLIGTILVLALLLAAGAARAAAMTRDFEVQGWSCKGCSDRTETAVEKVQGVQDAKADYDRKVLSVTYDDAKTGPAAIRAAIEKAGFRCPLPEKDRKKD